MNDRLPSTYLVNLRDLFRDPSYKRSLATLWCVNLFILLCRPQNNIPPIALVGIPILLGIPTTFFTLSKLSPLWRSSIAVKSIFLFLLLGVAWVPFARNNFWAFQTVRDVFQLDFAYLLPGVLLLPYAPRLRRVAICLCYFSIYLGLYSVIHGGQGPGGFLGDENDNCMLLVSLLGIPVFIASTQRQFGKRIVCYLAIGFLLVGIVSTMSRGGFVGLVCIGTYLFAGSPRKVRMIFLTALAIGLLAAVAPQKYWKEMNTITNTEESTAKGRLDVWKVGIRMWLHPSHFPFGTGMQNTPYHLGDFEPADQIENGRSMSGRAVHSSYVQLLGDLGFAGLILFLSAILPVLFRGQRLARALMRTSKNLPKIISQQEILEEDAQSDAKRTIAMVRGEIDFLHALLLGINGSLFGALAAGVFVSAVYYPTIWLFVVFGIAAQSFAVRVLNQIAAPAAAPATLSDKG